MANETLSGTDAEWAYAKWKEMQPFKDKSLSWFERSFDELTKDGEAAHKWPWLLFILCRDVFAVLKDKSSFHARQLSAALSSDISRDEVDVAIERVITREHEGKVAEVPAAAIESGEAKLDKVAFADERYDVPKEPDNEHEKSFYRALVNFVNDNVDIPRAYADEAMKYLEEGWYEQVFATPREGTKIYRGMCVTEDWLKEQLGVETVPKMGVSMKDRTYAPLRCASSWSTSSSVGVDFALSSYEGYHVVMSTVVRSSNAEKMLSLRHAYSMKGVGDLGENEVITFDEVQYSVLVWRHSDLPTNETVKYLNANIVNPKDKVNESRERLVEKSRDPEAPKTPAAKLGQYAFADEREDVPEEPDTARERAVFADLMLFFAEGTPIPEKTVRELSGYVAKGWYEPVLSRVPQGTQVYRGLDMSRATLERFIGPGFESFGERPCTEILDNWSTVSSWSYTRKAAVGFCYAYNEDDTETYSVLFTAQADESMISCAGMKDVEGLVEHKDENEVLATQPVRPSHVQWCAGRYTMTATREFMLNNKKPREIRKNVGDWFSEIKALSNAENAERAKNESSLRRLVREMLSRERSV